MINPNALSDQVIESCRESEKKHNAYVWAAHQSLREARASGNVYDGDEYLAYARARLQGKHVSVPQLAVRNLRKAGAKPATPEPSPPWPPPDPTPPNRSS